MTRGRLPFRAARRGVRSRKARASARVLATGLLTLTLLLRALLPAAQALPAPAASGGDAAAPWAALVVCSALGGSRLLGQDGAPERPAGRSDCLVCQAFGLGQTVAAQPAVDAAAVLLPAAAPPRPPRLASLAGRRPGADPARAPPTSRVLP